MAYYTWTGNVNKGEAINKITLRQGTLVILPGQYADLTTQEVTDLSNRVILTPGQSSAPANLSTKPTPPPTIIRLGSVGPTSTVNAVGLSEISVSATLTVDHTMTITNLSGWVRIFFNIQQDPIGRWGLTINGATIPLEMGPNDVTLGEGRFDGSDLYIKGS